MIKLSHSCCNNFSASLWLQVGINQREMKGRDGSNLIDRHCERQGISSRLYPFGSVTPPFTLEYAAEPLAIKLVLTIHD
jgi:hypothetical protein